MGTGPGEPTVNTTEQNEEFAGRLAELLTRDGGKAAKASVKRYLEPGMFTGSQFEQFCDTANPHTITANDLLAVQMLSVNVPARPAVWILGDGQGEITKLLKRVPADVDIWDATDAHFAVLEELWVLLGRGCWPQPQQGNGVGPTINSKVIATKRPRMAPVIDSVVREALGSPNSIWEGYRYAFSRSAIKDSAESLAKNTGLSALRATDVAVWMAHAPPR